ncbi:hypothetical protein [Cellulomonas humilata]|uniref:PPM-type phosphatase domain-containing protein n=1 Tax=Cellulomonas humilata TaxID=144055 RepID=A0ABU0EL36_9CELL|nr:hypothetical protein [Cellulomonas humilata]MDQ0375988.1 hypothetical protein [Cellulomonas humilata]
MSENAKPFVTRTSVLTVAQYVRLGYASTSVRLHRWADDLQEEGDWTVDDEFPAAFHQCVGRTSAQALVGLELTDDDQMLLLTDGFWAPKEAKEISAWKRALPDGCLRVIKVGSDAHPQLTGADVFAPDEILAALNGWLPEPGR